MGLWGSFTGDDQRDDLRRGRKRANEALKEGFDPAFADYTGAMESYQPYVDSGNKSQAFYSDLIGLNGDEARARAQGVVTSDPQFQGQLGANSNAMLRHLNARGASAGGEAALAGQRVLQSTYGDWINRYRDGGSQGLNATNAMASARQGRGNLSYGYGATKAGMETNFGNAMADSRGIFTNNLLGVASLGVSAMKPTPKIA